MSYSFGFKMSHLIDLINYTIIISKKSVSKTFLSHHNFLKLRVMPFSAMLIADLSILPLLMTSL